MKILETVLLLCLASVLLCCSENDPLEGEIPYTIIESQEGVVGSGNNVVANFFVEVTEEVAATPRNMLIISRQVRGKRLDPINTYFFTSSVTIPPKLKTQWLINDPEIDTFLGKVLGSYSPTEKRYYYTYIPFRDEETLNETEIIN